MKTLAQMLTDQIVRNEITVEQARAALIDYHHRRPRTLAEIEESAIKRALARNNDSVQAAARELGIGKTTLYRRLRGSGGTVSEARSSRQKS